MSNILLCSGKKIHYIPSILQEACMGVHLLANFVYDEIHGADMTSRKLQLYINKQEHVARVRFPDSASYVGWVCCWFSSLLRGFFSGFSGFPSCTKINTSKFQFDRGSEGHRFVSRKTVTCYPRKIRTICLFLFIYCSLNLLFGGVAVAVVVFWGLY